MLSLVLCLWTATPAPAAAPKLPEDCDALYYSEGRQRDFKKALACYRAQENWAMVAVMQLNGEGTAVDVAGARASYRRMLGPNGFEDADASSLGGILKEREATPGAKAPRVDFCQDIAGITPSLAYCARREENGVTAKDGNRLAELRARLAPGARLAFDAALGAFGGFVDAEGRRVYQKWIDGTIRNEASIAGESFARANFMAEMEGLARAGAAGPTRGKRSFADADRALNAAYRDELRGYASTWEGLAKDNATAADLYRSYVRDYKAVAHAAQHLWVRYRDAMGNLAAARWPGNAEVGELVRALVTEDRIRELTPQEGDVR